MKSMDIDTDNNNTFPQCHGFNDAAATGLNSIQLHEHHQGLHYEYREESNFDDDDECGLGDRYGDADNEEDSQTHGHLDDHGYSSLHDIVEVDMKCQSSTSTDYPKVHYSLEKSATADGLAAGPHDEQSRLNHADHSNAISSTTNGFGESVHKSDDPQSLMLQHNNGNTNVTCSTSSSSLPPINSNTIDLDSSVSNLSWLQNIQQQVPENARNVNSLIAPQNSSPTAFIKHVGESQRNIRVVNVTMPSNVHLSNTGNIKYVTVQGSKHPVRISASRPLLSNTPAYSSTPHTYHRLCAQNSGALPSSTVPDNPFPKPAYSYSCLIALSLKNSRHGSLPVAEIYNFMMTNFPYFKTAPDGWKNSVRHNLSLNKCFEKIENPNSDGTHSRKGCLWAMNPSKVKKMDEEIIKWSKKDLIAIRRSMAHPDTLDILTRGQGSYLMEKSRRNNPAPTGSHFPHRPGIRIVTAVSTPPSQNRKHTITPTVTGLPVSKVCPQTNVVVERQDQFIDQIDFSRLVEDAADLFGDHDDLTLDPSLSEIALQNGMFEEIQNDLFELPPLCNQTCTWTPTTSSVTATSKGVPSNGKSTSHMYNASNTVLPIIF